MNYRSLSARQQTDAFVTALLKHCASVEVQSIRNINTPDESPKSVRVARSLADLERLRRWLWHENESCNGQILIRPAAEEDHPWLLLDDVPSEMAERIARKYAALVVETTPGNCQIRVLADRPLSANERLAIQGELVSRLCRAESRADEGSTSGVKMGRLPGYKNRKPGRGGCWTNLIADTSATAPRFVAVPPPHMGGDESGGRGIPSPDVPNLPNRHTARHTADRRLDGEGGYIEDFAYACHLLRACWPEHEVITAVAERGMRRGKRHTLSQALRYARETVEKARRNLR